MDSLQAQMTKMLDGMAELKKMLQLRMTLEELIADCVQLRPNKTRLSLG